MSKSSPSSVMNNEIEPPLDFSFMNMTLATECLDEEPRIPVSPRKHKSKKTESGKSGSRCLKLCNNNLAELTGLEEAINGLFDRPEEVSWLDLSFNELTKVDECLLNFPNLQILYLHGNQIADLKEIDKLANCKSLKKLTLHGNNIDNQKGYRQYVLSHLPNLQFFDFSRVTKADRATATTISHLHGFANKKTKKKKEEDD